MSKSIHSDIMSSSMTSESPEMSGVLKKIESVAPTATTVLLTGETGVGKSRIAKMIHDQSSRSGEAFVSLNCGAIPESLVESELFGHEKGSFTGAIRRKLGKFELANNGTLFLDEVGTLSLTTQVKLLQILQEKTFQRVGGESDIKVDVRVITATNESLKDLVEKKLFRGDLFYRLNVFPIDIPPLRERTLDIPGLVSLFLEELSQKNNKEIKMISEPALEALMSYSWPGNIRELENIIERAFILETTDCINPESLPLELIEVNESNAVVPMDASLTLAEARTQAIAELERQYLKEVLANNRGRIAKSAQVAGVGVRQLHKLLKKYNIDKKEFR
jgi:transcriptional regulator with GAF, ATPase, and Fis domain